MFLLFHEIYINHVTDDKNLHSNMFLLFLELTLQYPQEGRHLHSNMFLLFRNRGVAEH